MNHRLSMNQFFRQGFPLAAIVLATLGVLILGAVPADASSHREAPLITEMPKVDGTDFYMFRSYESGRSDYVTLVANYLPLQDPYGGPNYFSLDPDAFYDIHVDQDGDGVEDVTFRFKFGTTLRRFAIPVGGAMVPVPLVNIAPTTNGVGRGSLNRLRSYTVRVIRGPANTASSQVELPRRWRRPAEPLRDARGQHRQQELPELRLATRTSSSTT